ncbi:MAG: hypothetical protein P4L68_06985 [Methylovirgula sp.]|nr:hypothetical protein [Methylovirgula sp.]
MRIFSRALLLALNLSLALPAIAAAQTAAAAESKDTPVKIPSDVSVLAYGAAHPNCLEWTDGCRICLRSPDGRLDCSTPGIACQPQEIVCKKEEK